MNVEAQKPFTSLDERAARGLTRVLYLRHTYGPVVETNQGKSVFVEVKIPTEQGEQTGSVKIDDNFIKGVKEMELTHHNDLVRAGHQDVAHEIATFGKTDRIQS